MTDHEQTTSRPAESSSSSSLLAAWNSHAESRAKKIESATRDPTTTTTHASTVNETSQPANSSHISWSATTRGSGDFDAFLSSHLLTPIPISNERTVTRPPPAIDSTSSPRTTIGTNMNMIGSPNTVQHERALAEHEKTRERMEAQLAQHQAYLDSITAEHIGLEKTPTPTSSALNKRPMTNGQTTQPSNLKSSPVSSSAPSSSTPPSSNSVTFIEPPSPSNNKASEPLVNSNSNSSYSSNTSPVHRRHHSGGGGSGHYRPDGHRRQYSGDGHQSHARSSQASTPKSTNSFGYDELMLTENVFLLTEKSRSGTNSVRNSAPASPSHRGPQAMRQQQQQEYTTGSSQPVSPSSTQSHPYSSAYAQMTSNSSTTAAPSASNDPNQPPQVWKNEMDTFLQHLLPPDPSLKNKTAFNQPPSSNHNQPSSSSRSSAFFPQQHKPSAFNYQSSTSSSHLATTSDHDDPNTSLNTTNMSQHYLPRSGLGNGNGQHYEEDGPNLFALAQVGNNYDQFNSRNHHQQQQHQQQSDQPRPIMDDQLYESYSTDPSTTNSPSAKQFSKSPKSLQQQQQQAQMFVPHTLRPTELTSHIPHSQQATQTWARKTRPPIQSTFNATSASQNGRPRSSSEKKKSRINSPTSAASQHEFAASSLAQPPPHPSTKLSPAHLYDPHFSDQMNYELTQQVHQDQYNPATHVMRRSSSVKSKPKISQDSSKPPKPTPSEVAALRRPITAHPKVPVLSVTSGPVPVVIGKVATTASITNPSARVASAKPSTVVIPSKKPFPVARLITKEEYSPTTFASPQAAPTRDEDEIDETIEAGDDHRNDIEFQTPLSPDESYLETELTRLNMSLQEKKLRDEIMILKKETGYEEMFASYEHTISELQHQVSALRHKLQRQDLHPEILKTIRSPSTRLVQQPDGQFIRTPTSSQRLAGLQVDDDMDSTSGSVPPPRKEAHFRVLEASYRRITEEYNTLQAAYANLQKQARKFTLREKQYQTLQTRVAEHHGLTVRKDKELAAMKKQLDAALAEQDELKSYIIELKEKNHHESEKAMKMKDQENKWKIEVDKLSQELVEARSINILAKLKPKSKKKGEHHLKFSERHHELNELENLFIQRRPGSGGSTDAGSNTLLAISNRKGLEICNRLRTQLDLLDREKTTTEENEKALLLLVMKMQDQKQGTTAT